MPTASSTGDALIAEPAANDHTAEPLVAASPRTNEFSLATMTRPPGGPMVPTYSGVAYTPLALAPVRV